MDPGPQFCFHLFFVFFYTRSKLTFNRSCATDTVVVFSSSFFFFSRSRNWNHQSHSGRSVKWKRALFDSFPLQQHPTRTPSVQREACGTRASCEVLAESPKQWATAACHPQRVQSLVWRWLQNDDKQPLDWFREWIITHSVLDTHSEMSSNDVCQSKRDSLSAVLFGPLLKNIHDLKKRVT